MPKILQPKQLLQDLRDWGMSLSRIAKEIGVTEPTLSRLATGEIKRPRVETEEALRKLHNKYIGD